jgi:hypothetical protein
VDQEPLASVLYGDGKPEQKPAQVFWHVITPEYPPMLGGVSDYTQSIAKGLAAQGDEVHVWCPAGGTLILTMPNQESIRSYLGLLFAGHFVHFLGASYPAHITALLRTDLDRICTETRFTRCRFVYTNVGGIPKLPRLKWQQVSLGLPATRQALQRQPCVDGPEAVTRYLLTA